MESLTERKYGEMAESFAREAGVEAGLHSYFKLHKSRLWETGHYFGLWKTRGKKVLEIGPFFSYTPLILSSIGNDVTVIEGPEPAVEPLHDLYEKRNIAIHYFDFFQSFGASDLSNHRLPFGDNTFDIINCWETMEHFNFNPVGFVKELRRVLKPGCAAYITVPNNARLELRGTLLLGRSIHPEISSYFRFYDYNRGRFYGWHWREYVMSELRELFTTAGFEIKSASHQISFMDYDQTTLAKRMARMLVKLAFALAPSTGKTCAIAVQKPA